MFQNAAKINRFFSILFSLIISPGIIFVLHLLLVKRLLPHFLQWQVSIALFIISLILLYRFFTRKYRFKQKVLAQKFPQELIDILTNKVYYYSLLATEEKLRFQKLVQLFLAEVRITGIETEVDNTCRVLTAASAIMPVFQLPEWQYSTISEVLIYPKSFDEDYNFDGEDTNILGMVYSGSVLILSKPALYKGFENFDDKQNVGIHEFAHKIDEADGVIDGVPALLIDRQNINQWLEIVESESQKIREKLSDINPYALTNAAEFFSVSSEYFFERPAVMQSRHPELYQLLKKIYRQDTRSLFTSSMKELFLDKKKKIGRNSPCPCGSGKKYKRCCLSK